MTRIARRGHRVDIYTMKWWDGPVDRHEDGLWLHGVVPLRGLYTSSGRRSIWQALWFGWQVMPALMRAKFDLLDVDHMPFFPLFSSRIVGWLRRKPMSATWHEVWGLTYWNSYLSVFLGWIAYLVEKISVYMPDRIVSDSQLTTDRLKTMLRVAPKKIFTLPIGINNKLIQSAGPRTYEIDLIYFGRLLSHKNVDRILKVVVLLTSKHPALRCLIIGNGPERSRLEQLAVQLGISKNIVFKDFLPSQEEVYSLLRQSKVFVSLSTREGFGLAPLEAMAAGLPVIIVDHHDNAVKEFVDDGIEGFVCPLDDQVLADKIELILNDDDTFIRLSSQARNRAQTFDVEQTVDKAIKYYQALLDQVAH